MGMCLGNKKGSVAEADGLSAVNTFITSRNARCNIVLLWSRCTNSVPKTSLTYIPILLTIQPMTIVAWLHLANYMKLKDLGNSALTANSNSSLLSSSLYFRRARVT